MTISPQSFKKVIAAAIHLNNAYTDTNNVSSVGPLGELADYVDRFLETHVDDIMLINVEKPWICDKQEVITLVNLFVSKVVEGDLIKFLLKNINDRSYLTEEEKKYLKEINIENNDILIESIYSSQIGWSSTNEQIQQDLLDFNLKS